VLQFVAGIPVRRPRIQRIQNDVAALRRVKPLCALHFPDLDLVAVRGDEIPTVGREAKRAVQCRTQTAAPRDSIMNDGRYLTTRRDLVHVSRWLKIVPGFDQVRNWSRLPTNAHPRVGRELSVSMHDVRFGRRYLRVLDLDNANRLDASVEIP